MSALPVYLRLIFLVCAGAAAFYSTARWTFDRDDSADQIVELARPPAAPGPAKVAPAAVTVPEPVGTPPGDRTRSIPKASGELFSHLSWLPPAPPPAPPRPVPTPPPAAALPPVATAPAIPFSFIGMLEKGPGKPVAFLARGDALLVVSAGDLLDGNTYRVERLNANEIVMTYLPLNVQQTLHVPGSTR
jgi:hypothetical protein